MKRRVYKLFVVGAGLLAVAGWMAVQTASRLKTKQQTTERRQRLAVIPVHCETGWIKLNPSSPTPTVVMYFHPECDHCQYEAAQLGNYPELLGRARIWLVSTEPDSALRAFARRYRLNGLPGVAVGRIEPRFAFDSLGFRAVPHLLVYGPDGRLKKEFRGETRWEAIERAL